MTYADSFLRAHGTKAVILRKPPIFTRMSIKRSTNSVSYLGAREGYYTGIVLTESGLKSGEVFSIEGEKYLVQSALKSFGDNEIEIMAAKTNAVLELKRYTETVDDYGNIVQGWGDIKTNIYSFGEIVTYQTRQTDPGILEGTRYIFQVSKVIGFVLRDRIVYNGKNYDVISIDDVLDGIARLQVAVDSRGNEIAKASEETEVDSGNGENGTDGTD